MTMWGWWQWWWQQWNKWWQCWFQQRRWWRRRSEKRGSTLYPCPNIPAYSLYLPPSHSVRILSDSSCIYAAIRSICIGFNDGFVYIFSPIVLKYSTIHPEQVLYNAIYKILPGDRRCDIHQLTCKSSRKKCHFWTFEQCTCLSLNTDRTTRWQRQQSGRPLQQTTIWGFSPSVFCAVGWCRAHVLHGDYLLCVLSHLVCLGCTVAHSGQGTEGWRHSLG